MGWKVGGRFETFDPWWELQCLCLQNFLVESSKYDSLGERQRLIHLCISDPSTSCNRPFMLSGSELFLNKINNLLVNQFLLNLKCSLHLKKMKYTHNSLHNQLYTKVPQNRALAPISSSQWPCLTIINGLNSVFIY